MRILVPFDLTEDSTFVDCTQRFARMMGLDRDRVITGMKVSNTLARSTFFRLQKFAPLFLIHGSFFIRNLPAYMINQSCDAVVSVETDAVPVVAGVARDQHDVHPLKIIRVARFLQVVVLRHHPLRLAPQHGSLATTVHLASGAELPGLVPSLSLSTSVNSKADADSSTMLPTLEPSSALVTSPECTTPGVAAGATQPASDDAKSSLMQCPAVFVEPVHPRPDDSTENVGWISPWSSDQQGKGVPDPWTRIEGPAARKLHSLFDPESSELDATALLSPSMDSMVVLDESRTDQARPVPSPFAPNPSINAADSAPALLYHSLS